MQAGTHSSKVLPGAAQAPGRLLLSKLSSANVFAPLSLGSTLVSSSTNAPLSRLAVALPSLGLLPPPVGAGAAISLEQAARNSVSTGQYSDAFTSWSHPESASGSSAWHDIREIVIDEGPLMPQLSALNPSDSTSPLPNYLINLQHF